MLGAAVEESLKSYLVTTPNWCVGDVMGEINRLRGWLDGMEEDGELVIVNARVPEENVSGFQEWLAKITKGKGKIRENA